MLTRVWPTAATTVRPCMWLAIWYGAHRKKNTEQKNILFDRQSLKEVLF